MMTDDRKFLLAPDDIRPIAFRYGACRATDRITVGGAGVGFMYREAPSDLYDSGWTFTAGDETQLYVDDPSNWAIYDVNTIANYDPDVLPLLNAPAGSAYGRSTAGAPLTPEAMPTTLE